MATNIVAARNARRRPTLASNSSNCNPADSVFDTNILLSHAICPSLCRYRLVDRERDRARVYVIASTVPRPHLFAKMSTRATKTFTKCPGKFRHVPESRKDWKLSRIFALSSLTLRSNSVVRFKYTGSS